MSSSYEDMMKAKNYQPYYVGDSLTDAMIAKAEKELGETEEVKAKTIPELRQLVQAEQGIVCSTDDSYLLMFLRARKFNVPRAFSMLKNYFVMKKENDDMFGVFDQDIVTRVLAQKIGFILPYRDEEGCVVGVIRVRKWDVHVTSAAEGVSVLAGAVVMALQEPATQICGARILLDVRGASLKQIRSLVPRFVILAAKSFKNCMPVRFEGFHLYNESPIFYHMVTFFKLFLTKKMKNRLYLHGDSQKHLHKYIPKAILPAEDFGGDNPDDIADWFNAEAEKYYEICREMATYGYR